MFWTGPLITTQVNTRIIQLVARASYFIMTATNTMFAAIPYLLAMDFELDLCEF